MKVLHSYCLNYNIGDYALGIGVKNVLRNFLDIDLIAETNLQGRVFDDYYIDIINNKYDLLVIGGGGIIHGAHWPQGWFWLIERENIKKIRIPFIIYGAGYNYFRGETGIPERGIEHLKETISKAAFFTVRNDGSRERLLEQTGINAEVIADPGFWVPLGRNFDRIINDKYVIIQVADDKPLNRYRSEENRITFISRMRKIVKHLSEKYKVLLAPHVFEDVALSTEIADGISDAVVWDFGKYAFDRVFECLGFYKYAEFVLSMRGHGQIVPLGFGVPVISLENHKKNIGLMMDFNLEEYNVDVHSPDLCDTIMNLSEKIRGEEVIERINKRINELYDGTAEKFCSLRSRL